MRLKIKEVSFTTEENWTFKLSDDISDYYILDERSYKSKGFKSPITKHELDYRDVGHSVLCETDEINGLKIVTKVK